MSALRLACVVASSADEKRLTTSMLCASSLTAVTLLLDLRVTLW